MHVPFSLQTGVATVRLFYPELDEDDLYARVELMAMISESFILRSIKKPEADGKKVHDLLHRLITQIWT